MAFKRYTKSDKMEKIDQYISGFPEEIQEILQRMREAIRQAAPEAEETISYGIPTFKLNGNLVHFAGYQNHIGFYPGTSGIQAFAKEFKGLNQAKGSVQFPLDKPIPYALIKRVVKFRVKENTGKAKK
jgi:uncharacterized protein YdhG (YjbR/CyaY superfamily)